MKISEIILSIDEGVNDPSIFKAVFLVGGPGSGKSYMENKLGLKSLGFVSIDSDALLTLLMNKEGLSLKMPPEETKRRDVVRGQAKVLTIKKRALGVEGRLGLVIQGTGSDFEKIKRLKEELESIGYETFMIVVNTNLDIARSRNHVRPRSVEDQVVVKKWQKAQQNIGKFLNIFKNHAVIDNNGNETETNPQIQTVFKRVMNWAASPIKSPIARKWINQQQNY